MKAVLHILRVGPQVTVQDAGRMGLMRFGVPQSGPMDRAAFALAQKAIGGAGAGAGIEVSRGGLLLECREGPVNLALAGGGFAVTAAGVPGDSWQVLTLQTGDRLDIRPGPWGSWCYLVFGGRLQAPSWLGSQATHALSNLGGGTLLAGQELIIEDVAPKVPSRSLTCPVWARPRHVLRAVPGPQERFFPPEALETLFTTPFHLTDAWDRMGLRLRGPALRPIAALQIPSGPVLRGSLQLSGEGTATLLLADHQTTGGYPRLATVVDSDLDGLAQCRPHQTLHFERVTPEEAISLIRHQKTRLARFQQGLA
ncbi:biotin-dependent carboxyltransferase family protein [Neogemmobacter tilapiae]|uniref:Allophanate hydrolase n=1 Tax=Neogemmobacter tilapiae TaxID=875041 RepID=A0A918TNU0_9RHOB|nr:allophanate hydrolase [Gemmobacter tilapiae]GHC56597.1 allophanate hydrolase [Gemmobacter tilapiae]